MSFQFFDPSNNNNNSHQNELNPSSGKLTRFTKLDCPSLESVHANCWSLPAFPKGSWVQIVTLPSQQAFPLVGVAVGTYLLVRETTRDGAVRVQVMGQKVTLSRAIAQQVYVQPLPFDPTFLKTNY